MATDTKKISVILSMDIIRRIEDNHLTQTEAVTRGLEILFSDDYKQIESYKRRLLEDEKKILILEARLAEFETLRGELRQLFQCF